MASPRVILSPFYSNDAGYAVYKVIDIIAENSPSSSVSVKPPPVSEKSSKVLKPGPFRTDKPASVLRQVPPPAAVKPDRPVKKDVEPPKADQPLVLGGPVSFGNLPPNPKLTPLLSILDLPKVPKPESSLKLPSIGSLNLFPPPNLSKVELGSVDMETGVPVMLEKIVISPPVEPPKSKVIKVSSPYARPKREKKPEQTVRGQVHALEPKDMRSNFGRRRKRPQARYVPRLAPPPGS